MKIAIVVPAKWYSDSPTKFSINLDLYIQAIQDLGHEPLLVCYKGSEYKADYSVLTATQKELEQKNFWVGLNLDIVLAFTWMRHSAMLLALKEAGVFIVAKGDNDGMLSVRIFPAHHYLIMMGTGIKPLNKVRTYIHWLRRYFWLSQSHDKEIINSIVLADKSSIETYSAKTNLERMLSHYGREDLGQKLCVLPHLVSNTILTFPVTIGRKDKIVAIGRWDASQKDTPLLVKTLNYYLSNNPATQIVLIGGGGEEVFAPLCKKYQQVSYIGKVPREDILLHLSDTRVLLVTSLWESFHIAAHEALCLGATVVGPAVLPVPDICREGSYGTVAVSRKHQHIAAALEQEMSAWESGKRNPQEIADFWRPKLSGIHSVQQILGMAQQS